jgi:hypothetical protein
MARFAVGESHEPAARRPPGRLVSLLSGGDHQPSPSAGAARSGDQWDFWRSFQFGMSHRTGAATVANAAGGRLFILKHMHNVLIGRGILSESVFKQPNS